MTNLEIKNLIIRELPTLIAQDPEVRNLILNMTRPLYADKIQTESRFDRIMDELKRDREANEKKWAENQKKWDDWQKQWEEYQKKSDEKWAENQRTSDEKWAENQRTIERLFNKIDDTKAVYKQEIYDFMSAMGARWGFRSEASFRNGLHAILEKSFGAKAQNHCDFDETGEVFGRPEQIELDIIIKNGVLIICEIKSSLSKAEIYLFEKKARFYEKRHQRQAQRLIVISPMIDDKAKEAAQKLGIEFYSYAEDVKADLSAVKE